MGLCDGQVEHTLQRQPEVAGVGVAHDTNDLGILIGDADALADRLAFAEHLSRQRLVDQRHARRVAPIRVAEAASAHDVEPEHGGVRAVRKAEAAASRLPRMWDLQRP